MFTGIQGGIFVSKKNDRLRALAIGAMMAALSIVFERVLYITPASNALDFRIGLSNVPIILAGIAASPFIGAVCGVVSDIIGCFISGYAPFPLLTIAPLIMGFLPGFLLWILCRNGKKYSFLKVAAAILITHIIASVLVTTIGLSVMNGTPFIPLLIERLPFCAINLAIDITLVYLLLKTQIFKKR